MSSYYDVGQFQKRGEKWTFQRLGSARENEKGGWDVYLNALPLTIDGQCRISIQPPREKPEADNRDTGDSYSRQPAGGMDDEIPF